MTQSPEKKAQQMAKDEVQNTYPDVLRDEEHLRTHAFAIAEQQVHDTITPSGRDDFAVQHFADAFIAAYRHAVEERDAGQ
jgi:predicted SnoaL-like aldol condensation-catalyzing enzyme